MKDPFRHNTIGDPSELAAEPRQNGLRSAKKGRGALSNLDSRFNDWAHESIDDGWTQDDPLPSLKTKVLTDHAKTIISRNHSPDIPFEQSINGYRGCEHGCIYCYARPSHAYLGLSPGLDFETILHAKTNASSVLRKELAQKAYNCSPIALGANTDPYQPLESDRRITRAILELLQECRHPVTITTKAAMIERDIDLLASMAERNLVQVQISITTLDKKLARLMEPRAAAPERRLTTIRRLRHAGIPVTVMVAPIIPFLTDHEMESVLEQSSAAGAQNANYIMLRLPLELKELFTEWLDEYYPLKRQHILSRLTSVHGGKIYDSSFAVRQSGSGAFAELIRQRFRIAVRKLRLNTFVTQLDCSQFSPPQPLSRQMSLF